MHERRPGEQEVEAVALAVQHEIVAVQEQDLRHLVAHGLELQSELDAAEAVEWVGQLHADAAPDEGAEAGAVDGGKLPDVVAELVSRQPPLPAVPEIRVLHQELRLVEVAAQVAPHEQVVVPQHVAQEQLPRARRARVADVERAQDGVLGGQTRAVVALLHHDARIGVLLDLLGRRARELDARLVHVAGRGLGEGARPVEVPAAVVEHREGDRAAVRPRDRRAGRDDADDARVDVRAPAHLAARRVQRVNLVRAAAIRDEGDLRPVGAPHRREVVGAALGEELGRLGHQRAGVLAQAQAGEVPGAEPQGLHGGLRAAVGGEDDARAVGGESRRALRVLVLGQAHEPPGGDLDQEEILLPALQRREHDPAPVGREARVRDGEELRVEGARDLAALDVEDLELVLALPRRHEDHPLAVGRPVGRRREERQRLELGGLLAGHEGAALPALPVALRQEELVVEAAGRVEQHPLAVRGERRRQVEGARVLLRLGEPLPHGVRVHQALAQDVRQAVGPDAPALLERRPRHAPGRESQAVRRRRLVLVRRERGFGRREEGVTQGAPRRLGALQDAAHTLRAIALADDLV